MAQKFRKVDPRIWTDEGFSRLERDGKILALWMLTGTRVNRCGMVLWSAALASEETGIPRDQIDTVLDTVCDTVSWTLDTPSRVVFLTRWWRYNRPDNESALKGAMADLWDVPRNNLKSALKRAKADLPARLHTVYDTVLDTVYDTVSPQEKEQEKEQEKDIPPGLRAGGKKPPRKEAKPKAPRPRNPLFDAVAEVTGSAPKAAGPHIGKVCAALASEDPPFTPDEVREFGRRFFEFCSWAAKDNRLPTLGELGKYIGLVRANLRLHDPSAPSKGWVDFDTQPPRPEVA